MVYGKTWNQKLHHRGATGKFFWGGKVIFPVFPGVKCLFPVENFHSGRPKQISVVFKSEKQKKKKKSSVNFQFPTFPFYIFSTIFLLFFSIFPPFPFFPGRSAEISWSEISGGHSAPCPVPACYATVSSCACNKVITNFWGNWVFHWFGKYR